MKQGTKKCLDMKDTEYTDSEVGLYLRWLRHPRCVVLVEKKEKKKKRENRQPYVLRSPSVCLLWRNTYFGLPTIFWLSCFVFWYWDELFIYIILEINPLSVASFANTISYHEGCLFALFMVSFAMQKLLSLIRSNLLIFVFISITLGGGSKIFPWFMSECSAYDFPYEIYSGLWPLI